MTEPNVLFKNLARNIHYSTGTAEEDYPKLDQEFFDLIPEIMQIEKPFNVTKKEHQLQTIVWGLWYMSTNNLRTNIVKDFVMALDKFKMPSFLYEVFLGLSLRISIYTHDKELEQIIFERIPEKFSPKPTPCFYQGVSIKMGNPLGYNLFVFYFLDGQKEKAELTIKELITQYDEKFFNEEMFKNLKVPEPQKEEMWNMVNQLISQ